MRLRCTLWQCDSNAIQSAIQQIIDAYDEKQLASIISRYPKQVKYIEIAVSFLITKKKKYQY